MKALERRKPESKDSGLRTRNGWGIFGPSLFDGMFGPSLFDGMFGHTSDNVRPAVNAVRTEDELRYEFLVPGFDREEIEVVCENGILTVSGSHEEMDKIMSYSEYSNSSFSRSINIANDAVGGDVRATLKNGILVVTIPTATVKEREKISIKIE